MIDGQDIIVDVCVVVVVFLIIDLVWLAFIAKNLYQKELIFIMSAKPNGGAAILLYLILPAGSFLCY